MMKQIFFTFTITCFFLFSTKAQVVAGQIDDFEDGTTQGWVEGTSSPNPPINISTGGDMILTAVYLYLSRTEENLSC